VLRRVVSLVNEVEDCTRTRLVDHYTKGEGKVRATRAIEDVKDVKILSDLCNGKVSFADQSEQKWRKSQSMLVAAPCNMAHKIWSCEGCLGFNRSKNLEVTELMLYPSICPMEMERNNPYNISLFLFESSSF